MIWAVRIVADAFSNTEARAVAVASVLRHNDLSAQYEQLTGERGKGLSGPTLLKMKPSHQGFDQPPKSKM
jgi:hypothetical protein